jgi:hypothetical protein
MHCDGDGVTLKKDATMETDWALLHPLRTAGAQPFAVYMDAVQTANAARTDKPVPTGWCSWYHFFEQVSTAERLRRAWGHTRPYGCRKGFLVEGCAAKDSLKLISAFLGGVCCTALAHAVSAQPRCYQRVGHAAPESNRSVGEWVPKPSEGDGGSR